MQIDLLILNYVVGVNSSLRICSCHNVSAIFLTKRIRGLKLLLVLDILVKVRHAKFEPCKTSNLDTAILYVAITANCGRNKSSYKLLQKI